MCINTEGKSIVIEFVRNGKNHKQVRWCSDPTFFDDMNDDAYGNLKIRFASRGAEVFKISKLESIEICCD